MNRFPSLFILFTLPTEGTLVFMQVPVNVHKRVYECICKCVCVCVVCVWCVQWEVLLLKEVASHKSQLMSITLIRSSIHLRAQGPIHALLFTLVDPRVPRHTPTLTHTLTGVNCHSLISLMSSYTDAKMAPRCTHDHPPTHKSRNRLLFSSDSL